MSTDLYTPREYAEIAGDRASELRIDLTDGVLGRASHAEDSMTEQLVAAGFTAAEAEAIPADFIAQLRKIDAAAEALASAYDRLGDIYEAMAAKIHRRRPGWHFDGYTV